jgi:hypothetical protein
MLCIYRIKQGKEAAFRKLARAHWPTLRKMGLATRRRAQLYQGTCKKDASPSFVEIFEWKSPAASDRAHRTPEVMAIWGPMMPLLKEMELIRLRPVR